MINGDIHFYEDESNDGCCPVCQSDNIQYGDSETDVDVIKYSWSCQSCGANGNEIANIVFDGHVVHYVPEGYIIPDLETDDIKPEAGDSA